MTHPDPSRRKELAAIHVAAKQLALAEDSYRALVGRFSRGRTQSSSGLTGAERRALLDEFRRLGFARSGTPGQAGLAARPRAARRRDERPQAAKLRALWLSLWQMGEVADPSEGALAMFVKRHCDVEALQFATADQLRAAIEHLRAWCRRIGYAALPFDAAVSCPLQGSFKPGLIAAQWERLVAWRAFRAGLFARLDTWLGGRGYAVAAPQFLTDAQADNVIDELGRWLRRLAAERAASDPA